MSKPYFDLPINLPHAATIAGRLAYHVQRFEKMGRKNTFDAYARAETLANFLLKYQVSGDNPAEPELSASVEEAAKQIRAFIDVLEKQKLTDDRMGQAVRNFFECLGMGREGAMQSLRAGENPDSALRPF